jgi:hypothetical protein
VQRALAGKSSFLNALAGGVVSTTSLRRETFNPIWYQFSPQGSEANLRYVSEELERVHQQNEANRAGIAKRRESPRAVENRRPERVVCAVRAARHVRVVDPPSPSR